MKRFWRPAACVGLCVGLVGVGLLAGRLGRAPAHAADSFADPAFARVWEHTDRLVAEGQAARTWFWGPAAGKALLEDYAESPGGQRQVQYFDKSRMEINNPGSDTRSPFYVTNGLLTVELLSGRQSVGDSATIPRYPAQIGMTGDGNDLLAPSYAVFAAVSNAGVDHRAPDRTGQDVMEALTAAGFRTRDPAKAGKVKNVRFVPETGHNIPDVFWTFLNQQGPVLDNGQPKTAPLIVPWFYASGYPISEAYWVRATIGGKAQDVLLQAYERRTLTYTPTNPAGFQVEMGNIGQHYYEWRYNNAGRTPRPLPLPAVAPAQPAPGDLGAADKPIKLAFVPAARGDQVLKAARPLADQLAQITGYKFDPVVPPSYAAALDMVGAGQADVAWLAPFAYVLANQKFDAQVILSTVHNNAAGYPAVFITADPTVQSLADLKGKPFAYVDPTSPSGYLYPYAALKKQGLDPRTFFSGTVFLGSQDRVVQAVYNGEVAGGAVFGGAPNPATGAPTDARALLLGASPPVKDVLDKVRILGTTDEIPNDTVTVRAGLPPKLRDQIRDGLLVLAGTPDGKRAFFDLYQIDGLLPVNDAFYDPVRQTAKDAGVTDLSTLFPLLGPPAPRP